MRSVKIKTSELLSVLKENRATHQSAYDEAMIGYREAVVKEIKSALKKAQANEDVDHLIRAVRPTSYIKSYDTVIRMLEMSSENVVEITMQEFNQYVEDNWHWKQEFSLTASTYRK
jgi:hypothetical protein